MYKRILVPVDGSSTSHLALGEAIKLAKEQKSVLRIVHVIDTININVESVADFAGPLREGGQKLLREAEARARKSRLRAETDLLEIQKLSERISDLVVRDAAAWRADLIVIGTHGRRGLNRLLLGSVADAVTRSSAIPVLLIRGR